MIISTHVLDTTHGGPVAGLAVTLRRRGPDGDWTVVARAVTDADGRVKDLSNGAVAAGDYRLEFATGKLQWRDRSVGKGTLVYADGHLYLESEDNVVGLAEASPAGYKETGRFRTKDQGFPSWAHPVVSGGRLYIRDQGTLAAYNIKGR